MTTQVQAQVQAQIPIPIPIPIQPGSPSESLPDPGDLLPYGHPALQVDRIVRHTPGALEATKAVSYHELDAHLGSARPGRFRAGELLVHSVELIDRDEETATFSGVSRAGDGRTVLEVERAITLLRPADSFQGPRGES
jgi:3-hydroxyacyl-[acyl-carrier-protein] dehydratase